jgi:hypothetical protein
MPSWSDVLALRDIPSGRASTKKGVVAARIIAAITITAMVLTLSPIIQIRDENMVEDIMNYGSELS